MKKKLLLLLMFHVIGLSCMCGGVAAQIIVASNILLYGYFRAAEPNPAVLAFELVIAFYSLVYLLFLYRRLLNGDLIGKKPEE